MSNTVSYDMFNEFLGASQNDKRPAFFLHELKANVDNYINSSVNYDQDNVHFKSLTEQMKNKSAAQENPQLGQEQISSEFMGFLSHALDNMRRQGLVNKIHLLAGANKELRTLKRFLWAFVNSVLGLSDALGNVLNINSDPLSVANVNPHSSAQDFIDRIFNARTQNITGYDAATIAAGGNAFPVGNMMFHVKVNRLILKEQLNQAAQQNLPGASKDFFNVASSDENRYGRDANGLLIDLKNNNQPVHSNSQAFWSLRVDDKCMGTGLAGSAADCSDYLRDCLKGRKDGIANCKKYMSDAKYWDNAKENAQNILPKLLVNTLNDFNFDFEQYTHSVTKQKLNRVQSVDAWLLKLKKEAAKNSGQLTQQDYDRIAINEKLLGYLAMLVERCNNNPVILNPNFSGSANQNVNASKPPGGYLAKVGLAVLTPHGGLRPSSLHRNQTLVSQLPFRAGVLMSLTGGANTYKNTIDHYSTLVEDESKHMWTMYKGEYESLVQKLQNHGKSISAEDDKTIKDLIQKLRESEISLTKSVLYAAKYAELLDVYGQHDVNKVLNMDDLKKFVDARDHYFKKVSERRNTLYNIIRTVADATVKELKEVKSEVPESHGLESLGSVNV